MIQLWYLRRKYQQIIQYKPPNIKNILLTYLFGHYNLIQVLASTNLRRHTSRAVAAFLDSHQPVWPNAGRPSLSATSTTWLRFEEFTNWVGAIHTSDMTQPSKTLYFNTLHYVDVIVYIVQLLVCAILLCRRKVHKSYVGFSSRRRLMIAHLKMSASKSQHHIIKPAI